MYVKNVKLPYFTHLDRLSQATCITQFVLRKTDLNIKFKPENPSRASAGAVPIAKLIQIFLFFFPFPEVGIKRGNFNYSHFRMNMDVAVM